MKGCFIAFEGPEGAGKSTQIRHLAERLKTAGVMPVVSREPGGTSAGDAIREVILDPQLTMTPLTEFLLYSASRAEHVREVIGPALEANKVVISDRFAGASVAYQGHGRGVPLAFIHDLTNQISDYLPDITVLLDIDVELGLDRIATRGQLDRLEQADLSFHKRVRQGFLTQAKNNSSWLIFEANQAEDELSDKLYDALYPRICAKLEL
ncbi:MAG: dTMP kinase [Deinococcota bacterium]